jgi:hypothetical protein
VVVIADKTIIFFIFIFFKYNQNEQILCPIKKGRTFILPFSLC